MVSRLIQFAILATTALLLSPTANVLAAIPDNNDNCENWAASGECDANSVFMYANCATSCEKMEKSAADTAKELAAIDSFFDLESKDINGKMVNFEQFRGKVTIVVNVASYCGYTESHYHGLVDLWSNIKDENVEILAFPCNQFGQQEPESDSNIAKFAEGKGVTFTMMSKVDVNGPNASLVFKYLKSEAGPSAITWNFATYFVIGTDGDITSHSGVEPMSLLQYSLDLLKGGEL